MKLADLTPGYRIAHTPIEIAREPHSITSINWFPEGSAFVYQVWTESTFYSKLVSTEAAPSVRLINFGENIDISQIMPDGSALGTQNGTGSALWRVDLRAHTAQPEKVRDIPWTDNTLCVSPDGRFLAFATSRNGPTQIWVSHLDGSNPRVLVPSIPPFDTFGDRTTVASLSWSPDGKWITLLTGPGVGHGDDEARLFLVPSAGGRLRVLAELCFQGPETAPWSADSRYVFVIKQDKTGVTHDLFQVDIVTGIQTAPTAAKSVTLHDVLVPLPEGAQQPHLAQDGRYLYYQKSRQDKTRIVAIKWKP